jgi:hypothetical protein
MFAIFIDGLQAGISFALAGIFATPALIPVVGTLAAAVTVPLGLLLGLVINMSLSLTMGVGLIFLVHMFFPKSSWWKWGGFIGDTIPGLNNFPFWTLMVIRAWWEQASYEKKGLGLVTAVAGVALAPTRGIMSLKEKTMNLPRVKESLGFAGMQQQRVEQPKTPQDLTTLARTRPLMHDIRPAAKPPPAHA